jgi:hypothetical protein
MCWIGVQTVANTPPDGLVGDDSGVVGVVGVAHVLRPSRSFARPRQLRLIRLVAGSRPASTRLHPSNGPWAGRPFSFCGVNSRSDYSEGMSVTGSGKTGRIGAAR